MFSIFSWQAEDRGKGRQKINAAFRLPKTPGGLTSLAGRRRR